MVRADYGAFASAELDDVTFERCVALDFTGSALIGVDVPRCAPERLRLKRTEVVDARFGGGLDILEGSIRASVFGGPGSTLRAEDTVLEVVRFCDQEAGMFVRGELRCAACGEHDFTDGRAVCVSGTYLYERGCPAIELAPECDLI